MNKKLRILLFFFGMAIGLAALFGEHATELPFVLKIVAPKYSHSIGVSISWWR